VFGLRKIITLRADIFNQVHKSPIHQVRTCYEMNKRHNFVEKIAHDTQDTITEVLKMNAHVVIRK